MRVVDDKTEVVVGRFYYVRCAIIKSGATGNVIGYTPIIGEKHKDVQLGVDWLHYHVDGRFKGTYKGMEVDVYGRTNQIVQVGKKDDWLNYTEEIIIKKLKCKRTTTGIKPPPKAMKYNDWYDSMIGKSCKGRRCPHLGTMMQEYNGLLVCPLHNLFGCSVNEIIIKRPKHESTINS